MQNYLIWPSSDNSKFLYNFTLRSFILKHTEILTSFFRKENFTCHFLEMKPPLLVAQFLAQIIQNFHMMLHLSSSSKNIQKFFELLPKRKFTTSWNRTVSLLVAQFLDLNQQFFAQRYTSKAWKIDDDIVNIVETFPWKQAFTAINLSNM